MSTGFNDIHYFSQHLGIPTLGYGPGGEDIHAVNERARVRDLVAAAKIYADLLTSFDGLTRAQGPSEAAAHDVDRDRGEQQGDDLGDRAQPRVPDEALEALALRERTGRPGPG